jgi:tripartite ATP-independent transporter DctM subunit
MTNAGVSSKLFKSADKFMGHIPGGLGMATVGAATIFKAICGSSIATSATFAGVAIPEMDKHHYNKSLSTGIVATVGTLGILLPPSIVLIILGLTIQESIGRLFLAGIIPGLMVAFSYALIIYIQCKIKPEYGPPGKKSSWKERFISLFDVIAAIVIFLIVMGGIFGGIFTPSEAGAVGTVTVFIYTAVREGLSFKALKKAISDTLGTTCMVVVLIAGATIFGRFFAATKISFAMADWVGAIPLDRHFILLIIALIYIVGGSFIEDMAFLIMATPIFYPVILKLGFDPTWFVIFICIVLMIGVVIPPMAMNVFVVSNLAKVPTQTVYKGVYPLLIGLIVVGTLIMIFPQITLFLPGILSGQ